MAKFDRRELKVHGDARPFSLVALRREALLKRSDVRPLVEAVVSDVNQATMLTASITSILKQYLGALIVAENDDLREVRDMRRTTIRGDGMTAPQRQAA